MFDTEENTNKDNVNETKKNVSHLLEYDGQTGTIYKIWIINFLLRVITMGIYTFWAKVKVRKYVSSSFSLGGDRFEYTGTGGELFRGFLKAMGIWVLLSFCYGMLAVLVGGKPLVTFVLYAALYVGILYLIGAAIYAAFGYRISRTKWRGVRGLITKGVFEYANFSFLRTLLNIVTLGLKVPASDLLRHKFIMDRTYFGNAKAEFNGNVQNIFKYYLIALIPVPLFLLAGLFIGIEIALGSDSLVLLGSLIIPLIILAVATPLLSIWYQAALIREKYSGLKVGNISFVSTVCAGALFKFVFVNLLLFVVTAGLATPYIMQRRMRFISEHTHIIGDLDTSDILQAPEIKGGFGEGLDDVLGLDTGLM
jgi:uncharacterized membrane protein YjgN (DUF898 family)